MPYTAVLAKAGKDAKDIPADLLKVNVFFFFIFFTFLAGKDAKDIPADLLKVKDFFSSLFV